MTIPIISILIILPLLSIALILLFYTNFTSVIYLKFLSAFCLIISILCIMKMFISYDTTLGGLQFIEKYSFISSIGLNYYVAIDGLSLLMLLLTAFINLLVIIFLDPHHPKCNIYLVLILLTHSLTNGVFVSQNLLLFYVFFEAILIPMFVIIGIWGSENRIYATFKFFLYTFIGSLMFLGVIIYIFFNTGSLDINEVLNKDSIGNNSVKMVLCILTFVAFAVKVPIFPLHSWLPDAHVQAPTEGSVILAALLLKLGTYAILRILIPIFYEACLQISLYIFALGVISIIYGSALAFKQDNIKKIIAFSSIAHMGYVVSGIFSFTSTGLEGAIFQMVSHGLISAGLFFVIGIIYARTHTKEISELSGLAVKLPILAWTFMILVFGNIGVPGTSGFVGELFSLIGMSRYSMPFTVIATFGVVLSALYMLRLYKRVMLGVYDTKLGNLEPLHRREISVLTILCLSVMILGLYPQLVKKYLVFVNSTNLFQ